MCNKACVLLKVKKKHLQEKISTNRLVAISDVLYDDHIGANLRCFTGIIRGKDRIDFLPDEINECIQTEFDKLLEDEVIYIEVYKTEEE